MFIAAANFADVGTLDAKDEQDVEWSSTEDRSKERGRLSVSYSTAAL